MSDVDKLLSELLDSDDDSEGEDSTAVVDSSPRTRTGRDVQPVVRSEVGLANARHQPPALARSTTPLDDLLPSATSEQPLDVQHPDSEEKMAVRSINNQPSQGQAEPVDPFMSSESAVPDVILQLSNQASQCSDDAAASSNETDGNLNLLDADIPDADQLLSENQPIAAAMPHAAVAAAAVGRTYEALPGASGTRARDGDDLARESAVTIPDLGPSSSPSRALAISVDTVYDDAQTDSQPVGHFTVGSSQQTQLELQGSQPASSQELDSLLPHPSANMVPTPEAVTAGAQTTPDTSPVPAGAPQTDAAPALVTAASRRHNQEAIPTASDADGSFPSSSTQRQQQQQPASKDEDDAQVELPKQDAELKPHEAAMAKAEEAERRLLTDKSIAASQAEEDPAEALMSRLQWAAEDWPQLGRPDSRGGVLGGQVMMRLDLLNPFQEFFSGGTPAGSSMGSSRAVAAFRGVVAVGTSSSIVGVLMPRGLSADGHPSGQAQVVQLGDAKSEDHAVSCMAFSLQGNILLVGHASGEIVLWEFKRTGWEAVKALKDAHTAPITSAAFLESSSQVAISGDAKGRLMLHNVTAYLSITSIFAGRLSRSSQPVMLLDGQQLGPVCKVVPLHPLRPTASHSHAPAAAAADPTRPQLPQEAAAAHEGLFLAASLGGMLVARAMPDGRFTVLHNLARPPDTREGCLPYATWQPRTPASRLASTSTRQAPSATLVLAWEKKVYLMDVPLAGLPGAAPPDPTAASRGPMALLPARVTKSWESEYVVAGVCWLNEHALAVVSEQGPRSHVRLYDASGAAVKEKLVFEDSLVGAQHIVNLQGIPEQACHTALALTPERMLLLGFRGVRSARLLTWQERLAALRDLLLWDHALFLGLQIYRLAAPPPAAEAGGGGPGPGPGASSIWREEGQGAQQPAVSAALIALLLGYLDAALPHDCHQSPAAASEQDMQAAGAAETAIELCVLSRRADVLWGEVYPRYLACGQHPALLERLLPHILASKLLSLPPEVMQALVEHFSGKGQPEAVEKAVLHMDIASLDLNQVIRLCWRYGLLTALTYVLNRGLNDYMGPAAALLMPLLLASGGNSSRPGYRLLVYLRCCLTGQSFPPGSGSLPEALVPLVKAQLLAWLLYTTPPLLQQQLQGAGQAPEQAQEGQEEDQDTELRQKLPGPCPVLRRLITFDAGAVLCLLQQSLAGWEALETDLLEAANLGEQAAQLSERVRSATQVVVDAILDLLDAGIFWQGEGQAADSTAEALLFITGLLVEGRATADAAATLKVLRHLAQKPGSEDAFVAVLQTATLQGSDMEQALQVAQAAGFQQAVARAHYLAGNFLQALHCAIHATSTPGTAFKYIRDVLDEAHLSQDRSAAFRLAILDSVADLARNEPLEVATLILERFPEEHVGVVRSLANEPQLQYKYLQASAQVCGASRAVESKVRGSEEGWDGMPGVSAGVHDQLLAQSAMCEQFVALLCQFEPSAVLPFLQSHDSYRVESCLPHCQQFEVNDAQAYLLERLGDIAAAIKLYVQDIQRCNAALIQALLQGHVHLPNVMTTSGRLRGYAGSASLFSYSSGHTLLERQPSSPRAAGQQPSQAGQATLVASHQALKSAVALCQRHSLEASQDTAHHLWFQLLQCYVHQLRQIRQEGQQLGHQPQPGTPSDPHHNGDADWSLLSPRGNQTNLDPSLALLLRRPHPHSSLHSVATATTEEEKWAALQQLFTGFMEEVISGMAGYIPLKAIGQRILAQYTQQQFGDFRGTLLGLLSAYNYESSILTTASRLMGSDAFRSLFTLYQSKTRVSTHVEMVSNSLMVDSEDAKDVGADNHQRQVHQGVTGQEGTHELHLNLMPAVEQSKAQYIWSQSNDGSMPNSPAYRSGVDINFLRSHDI